ncbi:hypothetical protein WJ127_23470 (plasmid) [Salmonella enterica]|uniref:Uncharacterized protein n=4 Tax=Enterobacteriaceae TaxID=543 RepID=A0ACD5GJG1_ECOLX|nr:MULTISPECIES: hypothetical protein [Enterobacteriaceae]EAA5403480.1 hypothetical protein [Salmonella enterica subsp. enterica]EAB5476939.1 hypothetical protein [Salmonella enterica subsp. enterica serovar Chester]EAM1318395.1 hypothetical protein [Salmonella enterica]ECA3804748.1 hypothetical protein [Salmonella enterica subsp. enterica serovar Agona]EDQ0782082.1 hypothetical protein [Salmonella enterica subsp. enterica serovar 4,[5],12:i:-]MCL8876130.1 hypothetical protein [Salmonella ent
MKSRECKAAEADRKFFKVSAGIDWLDLKISLSRLTQHRYVQEELLKITGLKLWVEPCGIRISKLSSCEPRPGNNVKTWVKPMISSTNDVFRIRFRDLLANHGGKLEVVLEQLQKRFPFAYDPQIVGVEVFCDFRHKARSITATSAMTYRLQSALFSTGSKVRQFNPVARRNVFLDVPGARINPEWNLRTGNKWDNISWQVYHKCTDDGQKLPVKKQRARVEVTLKGAALTHYSLHRLNDMQRFRFETLAHLFKFRKPLEPEMMADCDLFRLTAINAVRKMNDATAERGLHSFNNIGRRDKRSWMMVNGDKRLRKESSHLAVVSDLQNAVKGALRRLHV